MAEEKPLYQDEQLKIDYFERAPEEHLLYIRDLHEKKGEEMSYVIPRGILSELATTSRGGIERKIAAFNDMILFALQKERIGIDGLHVALCQAYAEEERRIRDSIEGGHSIF